jgi:hypothetical protein
MSSSKTEEDTADLLNLGSGHNANVSDVTNNIDLMNVKEPTNFDLLIGNAKVKENPGMEQDIFGGLGSNDFDPFQQAPPKRAPSPSPAAPQNPPDDLFDPFLSAGTTTTNKNSDSFGDFDLFDKDSSTTQPKSSSFGNFDPFRSTSPTSGSPHHVAKAGESKTDDLLNLNFLDKPSPGMSHNHSSPNLMGGWESTNDQNAKPAMGGGPTGMAGGPARGASPIHQSKSTKTDLFADLGELRELENEQRNV